MANLILAYLQTLIWPAVLLFIVLRFRRPIGDFLERMGGESEEISASVMGIGVSARFRKELTALADESDGVEADELRQSVRDKAKEFLREEFRVLADGFYGGTHPAVRRQIAEEIRSLAGSLSLEDLLEFSASSLNGERVGAAIGLGVHMASSESTRSDRRVASALRKLLHDSRSRVRYRAAEALRINPQFVPAFEDDLTELAESDSNPDVRKVANAALSRRPTQPRPSAASSQ